MAYRSRPLAQPLGPAVIAVGLVHLAAIYALNAGLIVERAAFGSGDNLVSISPTFGPSRPSPYPFPKPPAAPPPNPPVVAKMAGPLGPTGRWVTPDDYPSAELRAGHEGTTRFRLDIGADGRVRGCEIVRSSGYNSLDAAACANVTKRGKFIAAIDTTGAAMPGAWSSAVRWTIPKD